MMLANTILFQISPKIVETMFQCQRKQDMIITFNFTLLCTAILNFYDVIW